MSTRTASPRKIASGILLGAVASGVAVAALSTAGTADANCASISGVTAGSSSGGSSCTSTPTSFAIGIGDNTKATANGQFTGAIAIGPDNGANDQTRADSTGALSLAMAIGKNTRSITNGNLEVAVVQGSGPCCALARIAQAGVSPDDSSNVALNLGANQAAFPVNAVVAAGQGNLAANLGGIATTRYNVVQANGTGNIAINFGGNDNLVSAGTIYNPVGSDPGVPLGTKSTLGVAFNAGGNNNTVTAIGPFAVAGVIGKDNLIGANKVIQLGPGTNINNM